MNPEDIVKKAQPLSTFLTTSVNQTFKEIFKPTYDNETPNPDLWYEQSPKLSWQVYWCVPNIDHSNYLYISAMGSIPNTYAWTREHSFAVDVDYATVVTWLKTLRTTTLLECPGSPLFEPGQCANCFKPITENDVRPPLSRGHFNQWLTDLNSCRNECRPHDIEWQLSAIALPNPEWVMAFIQPPQYIQRAIPNWQASRAWKSLSIVFDEGSFSAAPHQRLEVHGKSENIEAGWKTATILLDIDLTTTFAFFRKLEQSLALVWPGSKFVDRVGQCSYCKRMLAKQDYDHDLWTFDLKDCNGPCTGEEEKSRSRRILALPYLRKKAQLVGTSKHTEKKPKEIIKPHETLVPDKRLRNIIYEVYDRKCQYCPNPINLALKEINLEHIIPRSLPIADIPKRLAKMDITQANIEEFVKTLVPPVHDCVLNYTLACQRCNISRKRARLLHPVALEMLLNNARRKASHILDLYCQL